MLGGYTRMEIHLHVKYSSYNFYLFGLVNLQHPFISQAKPVTILRDLITEAMEMKAKRQQEQQRELEEEDDNSVRVVIYSQKGLGWRNLRCNAACLNSVLYSIQEEETEVDSHTMVKSGSEGAGTMRATSTMSDGAQTMIEHGSTMLESDLGTMVINSDDEDEEEDQGSMRSERIWCLPEWDCLQNILSRKFILLPSSLTHFLLHRTCHPPAADSSFLHGLLRQAGQQGGPAAGELQPQPGTGAARLPYPVQKRLPWQLEGASGRRLWLCECHPWLCCSVIHCGNVYSSKTEAALSVVTHFFRLLFVCVASQLKNLDFEELQLRLTALDPMMEREIEELRQRYTAKRQPILDAMDAKKRRQQNF